MAEYIERDAVNKLLKLACDECRETCEEFDGFYADCNQCIMHSVVKGVPAIPAADVREVVHGIWLTQEYMYGDCSVADTVRKVKKIPAADVRPVVHGKWVWNPDGMDWGIGAWECSNCHATPQTFWNAMQGIRPLNMASSKFCPNCGARMDGGGDV